MTLRDAVELLRARHVAAARLIQRSPSGGACDPADAAAWRAAAARVEEVPGALIHEAVLAWREQHECRELAECPLGPRPRRPS